MSKNLKEDFGKLFDEISKQELPVEENSKKTKEAIINNFAKNRVIDSDYIKQHNLEYRRENISNFIQLINKLWIDKNIGKQTISINIPISSWSNSIFVVNNLNKVLEEWFIQEAIRLWAEKDAIVSLLFNELIISYGLLIKDWTKEVLQLLKNWKNINEIKEILNIDRSVEEKIDNYGDTIYKDRSISEIINKFKNNNNNDIATLIETVINWNNEFKVRINAIAELKLLKKDFPEIKNLLNILYNDPNIEKPIKNSI